MIETAKKQIDKNLSLFLEKRKRDYPFDSVHPILFEGIKDFCARKGKRLRPLLMVLSYLGYTTRKKISYAKLYTCSACLELLHNFMLIHDDIIDCSDLRRGKPTLHKILAKTVKTKSQDKLGTDLAIVAGDIVYALAIDAFLAIDEKPSRKEKALKYFIQTAAFTAMGEFIDILHGYEGVKKIEEKDVFLNYSLKTARYTFTCPLMIGAILAGAPKKDLKNIDRIGNMLGQAFQIQDDIIGVFSTQEKIGKSILSDIEECKKTILVCHCYHTLSIKRRKVFMKHFLKTKKTYQDLLVIRKMFLETKSLYYSLAKVYTLLWSSKKLLDGLALHPRFKKQLKDALQSLFKQVFEIAQKHHISL